MEVWDLYNKDRELTGKTILKGSKLNKDEYRLVVHICIFNSKNKMLIQQRQPFKEGAPNKWDLTVGGSAISGDTSIVAAEREVFEEIGYKINLKNKIPSLTINFEDGFDDIYIIEENLNIEDLKLQYEEVKDIKWADKKEILNLIETGKFINYHKSFIELLFDIKECKSNYRTI